MYAKGLRLRGWGNGGLEPGLSGGAKETLRKLAGGTVSSGERWACFTILRQLYRQYAHTIRLSLWARKFDAPSKRAIS